MSPDAHDDAAVTWDLSRTDAFPLNLAPYLPLVVFGGYLGVATLAVVTLFPALLARPRLLPFALLFVLVGGPLSLLYLWPMLRDPDQRPSLPPAHWLRRVDRGWAALAVVVGAVALPVFGVIVGPTGAMALLIAAIFLGVPLLALLQSTGSIHRTAGTLTVDRRTVDLQLLAGYRRVAVGGVDVLWLRYTPATSWWGKPHLLAVPGASADAICEQLRRGHGAEPPTTDTDRESRDRDRLAQVVLVIAGLLFVGLGGTVVVFEPAATPYGSVVPALLGLLFLVGAYFLP